MRVLEYPRPAGDTGIGFHWFPDLYHYDRSTLNLFLPRLKAMGASWLTVLSEPYKPIGELFVRTLIDNAIEPVVRIYTPQIAPLDQAALRATCQTYANWGVHYIHVYNEPNLDVEWSNWSTDNLVGRFMDLLIPCLETMYALDGIVPVTTPLAPGGNYRDITFFRQMLDALITRGKSYLFSKLAIGLHNYALNHPLDWGRGGHSAWPQTTDENTPPGSQDSNGFRQFEWYDEIVREKVGFSLPMICGENGALPGSHQDVNYPAIDARLHAERHAEMARLVMENEVPYYLFNNAFWILTAPEVSMFAGHRWFRDSGEPILTASIQALEALPKHPRPLVPTFQIPANVRVLMPDGTVNIMLLEEYLKGVVPAEMPASSAQEALKAQAIAARTYAISRMRHPKEGADVCTTTHCQVWTERHTPQTDQAVEQTRGMVAVYDDKLIRAFYFAGCDGHTRNSEDVWVEKLPYCRSVSCVKPLPALKGHGVGLCQTGAMAMAEQGATAEAILQHYYTGIQVVRAEVEIPAENRQSIVQGTVRDQSGRPRVNVQVVLHREAWNAQMVTNGQGQYVFTGLSAGTYWLEIPNTTLRYENIVLDGKIAVTVDFLLPTTFGWQMNVRRQPGLRLLIGQLPEGGIPVQISDAWGHTVTVLSGSKPEYGPGGFETPIWVAGTYTIRFLNQEFKVDVHDETVFVTFTEGEGAAPDSRLISDWLPLSQAQATLQALQSVPEFANWFRLEQQEASGSPTGSTWEVEIVRKPGLRLIIGRLPRPGIPVSITDAWQNRINLVSGSKPEYGPGGFETPVWRDGTFVVSFNGQNFPVEMHNETIYLTFKEGGNGLGRLVSDWMLATTAQDRLRRLDSNPAFQRFFKIETKVGQS